MKTCLIAAGWAVLAPGLLAVATNAAEPVVAYAPGTFEAGRTPALLGNNASRATILERLGPPDAMLSPDIWIYWNYRGGLSQPTELDTLVVGFRRARVAGIKLTSGDAVRKHLAEQARRAPADVLRQPLYVVRTPER